MIETNYLNWASKEFPKEVSEIKYLTAVLNDINNNYNLIKNSVDVENKQLEIFFKSLISNSKSFMNEISSMNFNHVDSSNLINISMNFGNIFDLMGKIFCDENKIFNERISKSLNEFSQNLSFVNKLTNEIINFPFKDFSYLKYKKLQIFGKCEKSYKELELCLINSKNENYSKEKTNEKVFYIFSDFEDKIEMFRNLNEESTKAEMTFEEVLKSLFYNVIKISYDYLKFCKNFFEEITNYKQSFSQKILNTLTVAIESLTSSENYNLEGLNDCEIKIYEEKYNQAEGSENYFGKKIFLDLDVNGNFEESLENLKIRKNFINTDLNSQENRKNSDKFEIIKNSKETRKSSNNSQDSSTPQNSLIEIKNLPEISENFGNFIGCIQQFTSFKKKVLTSFSKFLSDIFRHLDILVQNLTKIEKTTYNFKSIQHSNTTYSYLINTSLISHYEFIRSLFDFFFKKQEEILSQKSNFVIISNSIETATKEISNEENNFVYIMQKLNKEYTNYRNSISKLVISKEKIITQLVSTRETLIKLEESSQSLTKTEIALGNLKSEESKINDQIFELNSNYKRFIEDLIENLKKSFFEYKAKDKIRFKEFFRDSMLNFMDSLEKVYSNMKEYLQFKDTFLTSEDEKKTLRNDLNTMFDLFMKEYLMCKGEEILEGIITNINRNYSEAKEKESDSNVINSSHELIEKILTNASHELDNPDKLDNHYFISQDISVGNNNINNKINELKLTNLLKEEDIRSLREKNNVIKSKIKPSKKSYSIKTKEFSNLHNLYSLINFKDEKIYEIFYVSYLSQFDYIIPGVLLVTNQRIVFQSFINSSSNGPTLINYKKQGDLQTNNNQNVRFNTIEVMKNELISIREINKTKLKIKTKFDKIEILFNYLRLANATRSNNKYNLEDFVNAIKKFYKINDLFNIQECFLAEAEIDTSLKSLDFTEDISNIKENPNHNYILKNLNSPSSNDDEFYGFLNEINFFNQIREFHKSEYDFLTQTNVIKQNFNECFVKDKPLLVNSGTDTYFPLHLIYKYIYDDQVTCNHREYNKSKNFILNLKEIRKDYNISFNYSNDSNQLDKIPKYYSDPLEYTLGLFTSYPENSQNHQNLKNFLDSLKENFGKVIEYEYKYTHPMKKKFMGPSKLDMHDKYKIIFVSPLCLIVEITTYLSGFMMMDSFFTVAQYKYEADLYYDTMFRRISWKTKVTASFTFQFVKECWFRNKIESNGIVENEEYIKDFVLVHVMKILEAITKEYYEKLRMIEVNRGKINCNSVDRLKTNTSSDGGLPNNNEIEFQEKPMKNNEDIIGDQTESNRIKDISENNIKNFNRNDNNYKNNRNMSYIFIQIFLVFTIMFAISNFFSIYLFGNSYKFIKELILILLLSINSVFLWKMYHTISDLQLRLNRIEASR